MEEKWCLRTNHNHPRRHMETDRAASPLFSGSDTRRIIWENVIVNNTYIVTAETMGCKDLELSLVSAAAEEDEDDSEVDMQFGGVLRSYADKFKVRRLKPAV